MKKRIMEVTPLSERKNLIVDPSLFAHPRAVSMLLRSKLTDEHSVASRLIARDNAKTIEKLHRLLKGANTRKTGQAAS